MSNKPTYRWNRDLRGTEIHVGDCIVVAAQAGYASVLRIGEVIELNDLKEKVKVEYQKSGGYYNPERPVWIESPHKKSVVLKGGIV
jgi:hypothetical protein